MKRALALPFGRDLERWLLACFFGAGCAVLQALLLAAWPEARSDMPWKTVGFIWLMLMLVLGVVVPSVCVQRLARRQHRWLQVASTLRWPGMQPTASVRNSFALVLAIALCVAVHMFSLMQGTDEPLHEALARSLIWGTLLMAYGLLLARWPAMGLLLNLMLFFFFLGLLVTIGVPLMQLVQGPPQWGLLAGLIGLCWLLLSWPVRVRRAVTPTSRWRSWVAAPPLLPYMRSERLLLPVGLTMAGVQLQAGCFGLHLPTSNPLPQGINLLGFTGSQLLNVLLLSLLLSTAIPNWRQQLHPQRKRQQHMLMPLLSLRLLVGLLVTFPLAALLQGSTLMAIIRTPEPAFSAAQFATLLLHLTTLVAAALLWRAIARQRLSWDLGLLAASVFIASMPTWLSFGLWGNTSKPIELRWWMTSLSAEQLRSPWLWLPFFFLLIALTQQIWARQSLYWLTQGVRSNAA